MRSTPAHVDADAHADARADAGSADAEAGSPGHPLLPAPLRGSLGEPSHRPAEPFRWPLSGTLGSGFGWRHRRMHSGVDLMAPEGTEILASRAGLVLYTGDGFRGYGNVVILDHGDGFVSVYAHAKAFLVREDERVGAGQAIALVGHTGNATAPHLHFEIREGDHALDPLPLLQPVATARAGPAAAPEGTDDDGDRPVEQ